ncbi:phage holin family protein [Luteimicrobium subarcticum]|uniref:Putative superfamily III holin-X n=1 Tax=Luteimicrobium subarcticum TaxID=620910 RepID=A0A2M8WSC7_9MICO|nr:phage holin family protein [Luteimicrobium subarcticum]PJI93847.1 putative superfamily III holin-X [Luteimicrobium subarcticum]
MSDWDDGSPAKDQRPSVGRLLEQVTENISRVVRTEIALIKAELTAKITAAAIGIGLFVVAALLAFFVLVYLIFAGYLGLAHAFPDWLAALLTAVGLLVIIAVLALVGKKSLDRSTPPISPETKERLKKDVSAIKEGATS